MIESFEVIIEIRRARNIVNMMDQRRWQISNR